MIINMRGTHGTGKTWVSHSLIRDYDSKGSVDPQYVLGKRFVKENSFPIGGGLYVIGRYKSGMDGIFPQEIIEEMISHWSVQARHIIWENVMVSANIGRWAVLAKKLDPINHSVWCFLDTPLQLCIDRVMTRREEAAAAGFNHRQKDSEVKLDVMSQHWRRCRRAAARAFKEGIEVRWVDHTQSYEQVHDFLMQSGWTPSKDIGLAKPTVPLTRWEPTADELDLVLATARLPWEPEDTQTKVAYKSYPKVTRVPDNTELGTAVRTWGAETRASDELGIQAYPWKAREKLLDSDTLTSELS